MVPWFEAPLDVVLTELSVTYAPGLIVAIGLLAILHHGAQLRMQWPLRLLSSVVFCFQVRRTHHILYLQGTGAANAVEAALMLLAIATVFYAAWSNWQPALAAAAGRLWPAYFHRHHWRQAMGSLLMTAAFAGITIVNLLLPAALGAWKDENSRIEALHAQAMSAFLRQQAQSARDAELSLQHALNRLHAGLQMKCRMDDNPKGTVECQTALEQAHSAWRELSNTLKAAGIALNPSDARGQSRIPAIQLQSMSALKGGRSPAEGSHTKVIEQEGEQIRNLLDQARHALGLSRSLLVPGAPKAAEIALPLKTDIDTGRIVTATLHLESLRRDANLSFFLFLEVLTAIWLFIELVKRIHAEAEEAYAQLNV